MSCFCSFPRKFINRIEGVCSYLGVNSLVGPDLVNTFEDKYIIAEHLLLSGCHDEMTVFVKKSNGDQVRVLRCLYLSGISCGSATIFRPGIWLEYILSEQLLLNHPKRSNISKYMDQSSVPIGSWGSSTSNHPRLKAIDDGEIFADYIKLAPPQTQ